MKPLLYLASQAATRWIQGERARHAPAAGPVEPDQRSRLAPYFSSSSLDRIRLLRVSVIENPVFYVDLPVKNKPLDLRQVAGITYDDVVLINSARVPGPMPLSLVFHELIHVVQYAALGVAEFANRYVMGWSQAGYRYLHIPLEVQAYTLQREFEAGALPNEPIERRIYSELGVPHDA